MNKTIQMGGFAVITPDFLPNRYYFEFAADDPDVQIVEPCRTPGTAQLMRNGTFYFTPAKPRQRTNSMLIRKLAHGRLSRTRDHAIQLTLKCFDSEKANVPRSFISEAIEAVAGVIPAKLLRDILTEQLVQLFNNNSKERRTL